MAQLIYGLTQSLDGFIDHQRLGPPSAAVFQHFLEQVRGSNGMVYGRVMYEVMRYWDDELAEWDEQDRAFAAVWRAKPKWVVSRTLTQVGPNATLIGDEVEAAMRRLKAGPAGEIWVGGADLARSLMAAGLIDEYRLYLRPVVLGQGKRYFAAPPPPLRLLASERIGDDTARLRLVPATA